MDYRYAECGLDNVIIQGMSVVVDDAGEEVYSIPNVIGLHRTIAACIVKHARGISPKELRFLRTEMGMTQAELAEIVKKDHQTVGRWERGETVLDQNAETVIRLLAAERLGMRDGESVADMAKRSVPSAQVQIIFIDGQDPTNYRAVMDEAA
ncbi:MAG TPA: helix-turn-helix domain-containing protein [Stellaceae bacterium]|nr:helix-turn-helix domain-containing protein [Stellaceae bacterium]